MRHLELLYINEKLNKSLKDKLLSMLDNDELNNEDIKHLFRVKSRNKLRDNLNSIENNFFDNHGLSNINWGRNQSAVKYFTKVFSKYNHLSKLQNIIKNDGVISIDNLGKGDNKFVTGNIFKDNCKGWEEEAKTIASWTFSNSTNAGQFEILLKFILKEGGTGKSGDVLIKPEKEMEVKTSTISKKNTQSGGHALGNRSKENQIRKTWSIYKWLNDNLFNIPTDNNNADKLRYFQNEIGIKEFNDNLKNKFKDLKNNDNIKIISDNIINALSFQYNYITNENTKIINNKTPNLNKLQESVEKYIKNVITENGFEKNDLLNLVGCIQLYLYSKQENFDYFFIVLYDKNESVKENINNGFYVCIKNCKDEDSGLLQFDKILNYLNFGTLDSTTSNQGRTGKMIIKMNN